MNYLIMLVMAIPVVILVVGGVVSEFCAGYRDGRSDATRRVPSKP